jgi:hypothetical protein
MPPPKPRKRPRVAARGRPQRRGAYADAVRPETSAAAYSWPCPRCPCRRNLRGILREVCSVCTHVHHPPATQTPCREESPPC